MSAQYTTAQRLLKVIDLCVNCVVFLCVNCVVFLFDEKILTYLPSDTVSEILYCV